MAIGVIPALDNPPSFSLFQYTQLVYLIALCALLVNHKKPELLQFLTVEVPPALSLLPMHGSLELLEYSYCFLGDGKHAKRHMTVHQPILKVEFCDFLSEEYSQAVDKIPTHYPCDSARTFRVILFSIHNDEWKSFQCHHQTALRIHKDGDGDASFQLKSNSLPHAHAQTTKTYYKHQDSRIMKAQELKTKTSAQTLIYKIFLQRYQVYQGRLLASFQDDAKYEHVGQDTRSQGGKDDQDGRIKV
ncbi:hypothetical protein Tco_0490220 [Tanacetum coccineum]